MHRDIKPANLLVDRSGCLKILDLGLAHLDDVSADGLTSTGDVMGTVDYMAPEQSVNTKQADARSDIYSLGCSLYYLLQGKPVYGGESMVSRIMAHRDHPIPPLAADKDDVPGSLELVFRKMIAKNVKDRFQNMAEVIEALEHCGVSTLGSNSSQVEATDPELQMFFDLRDAEKEAKNAQNDGTEEKYDETVARNANSDTGIVMQLRSTDDNRQRVSASHSLRSPQSVKKLDQERRQKRLMWIGGGTLAFLLIVFFGIVTIFLQTPAGNVILKMDQSALTGAKVIIDGENKLTIDQGMGTEKIRVNADDERHTLKVTKGGFETFTKSFTVKSGEDTIIEVWLEPAAATSKPFPANRIASSAKSGNVGGKLKDPMSAGDIDPMMRARLLVVDTRRKQYLAENLPRIQALKAPAPAYDRFPEVFPPSQATLAKAFAGNVKTQFFQDLECLLGIAEENLKKFARPYYKATVSAEGKILKVESYAADGTRAAIIVGCPAVRYSYNAAGKRTLEVYLDRDGNSVENRERVAIVAHAYENNRLAESRFYKADATPVDNVFGVHRIVRSDSGERRRFQLDGSPTTVWLDALNLGKRINAKCGWRPCLSPDGRELYFPVGFTGSQNVAPNWIHRSLWNGQRWSDPEVVLAGGAPLRGFFPSMSPDGSTLYVTAWKRNPWHNAESRAQLGGPDGIMEYPSVPNFGEADIYITRRTNGTWGPVTNAGRQINVGNEEGGASVTPDGKALLVSRMLDRKPYEIALFNSVGGAWRLKEVLPFTGRAMGPFGLQDRVFYHSDREEGFGHSDLWMIRRDSSGWRLPINLGDSLNTGLDDSGATLTPDGNIMYFARCLRPWNLYVSGRADSEIAVRHMAEIYAWQEWVEAGPSLELTLEQAVSISKTNSDKAEK